MKITPDPYTSSLPKTKRPTEPSPASRNDNPNQSATQNVQQDTPTHFVRQKILSWFSRVGISPSMAKDPKSQRNTLERRKQIIELQKAANLQAVLNIALNVNITESENDGLDPDWFFAFSNMAEEIHSPGMQELWGKIFAVEVSKPGSFSLRSLQMLKLLTQRDAKVFAKAVSIASRRQHDTIPRILVGFHRKKGILSFFKRAVPEQLNLASVGLSYPDLLALQDMKLLYASEIESGEYAEGQQTRWRCGAEQFTLESKQPGVALVYFKFTAVGGELYKLVPRKQNPAYLSALKDVLSEVFNIH